MPKHTKQIAQLRAGIQALEAQRSILGDAVVDLSLQALKQQIAELETPSSGTDSSEGERRQATILFSDLSGYTAMNEKLDPEKVQELMAQIKREAIQIVEHHGGIVNQFVGDEVLALFGIPNAHEDDPVRAVKAALELHALVREMSKEVEHIIDRPLTMHSGINTGLIVTSVWDERDGKFSLTGDTVNTGARIVAQAKGDEILVSPQTQVLIAPYFRTESLEPVKMKGKTEPVVPYRILGKTKIQTRLEAAKQRGFTPYIEREEELATLHACLEKTIKGTGQFVTVRGAAGLGKSRLLYEFRHQIDRQKVTVLQGRCQSYGASTPYLPFQDALRRGLHLTDEDTPSELHAKAVDNLLKIDPDLEKHLPVFLHLLSIPSQQYSLPNELSGEQLKLRIQETLVAIHTLNTKHQPMILFLEDWHWADEGSDMALHKLLDVLAAYPLMVVLLYRPEYSPKWNKRSYHTPIHLASVGEKGIVQMIKAIYGVEKVPDEFASQIFKHSEGNPFFCEELCSLLKEERTVVIEEEKLQLKQKLEQIRFPQTVQAVIRAKLDRLDTESKKVIRLASVIGREFLQRILEQITTRQEELPASLQHLKQVDFIRRIHHLPELTYQFNHVITQEVTYQTLLIKQRKVLHRLVAETIEILYAERLEEQFERLAYHYSKSKEWEKALYYLELAGDKAGRNFSLFDARTYYREALTLIDAHLKEKGKNDAQLKNKRVEITLKWTQVSHYAGSQETISILETSMIYAQEQQDKFSIAHLHYWFGQRHVIIGNTNQAAAHFTHCFELAEQLNEKGLLAKSYAAVGRGVFYPQAAFLKAKDPLEKSIPMLKESGELDGMAHVAGYLCSNFAYMGDFEKAVAYGEQAITISEKTGNLSRRAMSYIFMGVCYSIQGNWKKALETTDQVIQIARPLGDIIFLSAGLSYFGHALYMTGKQEKGLSYIKEGIQMMETNKIFFNLSYSYGLLTSIYAMERHEQIVEGAQKCFEWAEKGWKGYEPLAYYALAQAQQHSIDSQKVDQTIEQGFHLCRERGQRPFLAQGFYQYVKILLARRENRKAQTYLNQAIELFSEMNMLWWLEQARALKQRL